MKKVMTSIVLMLFAIVGLQAQNIVKGTVISSSGERLKGVVVSVKGTQKSEITNDNGVFELVDVPNGKQLIVIKKEGYETQNFPLTAKGD